MTKLMMACGLVCALAIGVFAVAPTKAQAGVYVRAPGVSVGVGFGRRYYRPYRYYGSRRYVRRPYYRSRPYYRARPAYRNRAYRRLRRRARRGYW